MLAHAVALGHLPLDDLGGRRCPPPRRAAGTRVIYASIAARTAASTRSTDGYVEPLDGAGRVRRVGRGDARRSARPATRTPPPGSWRRARPRSRRSAAPRAARPRARTAPPPRAAPRRRAARGCAGRARRPTALLGARARPPAPRSTTAALQATITRSSPSRTVRAPAQRHGVVLLGHLVLDQPVAAQRLAEQHRVGIADRRRAAGPWRRTRSPASRPSGPASCAYLASCASECSSGVRTLPPNGARIDHRHPVAALRAVAHPRHLALDLVERLAAEAEELQLGDRDQAAAAEPDRRARRSRPRPAACRRRGRRRSAPAGRRSRGTRRRADADVLAEHQDALVALELAASAERIASTIVMTGHQPLLRRGAPRAGRLTRRGRLGVDVVEIASAPGRRRAPRPRRPPRRTRPELGVSAASAASSTRPARRQVRAHARDRVERPPLLELLGVDVARRVVGGVVRAQPVGARLDQRRALPRARPRHGARDASCTANRSLPSTSSPAIP